MDSLDSIDLACTLLLVSAGVTAVGVIARNIIKTKREANMQENVVRTFSVETMDVLEEGTIEAFKETLEKKSGEVYAHPTWDVSFDLKKKMKAAFAGRIHDSEIDVRVAGYDLKKAEVKLRKSLEAIEEFHLQMAELKIIKRRRFDYKLVARLIEEDKEIPIKFFIHPVKNPVDNYSSGFELWHNLTFRRILKDGDVLKNAIRIESMAAKAMHDFSTARKRQRKAEEELEMLLELQQKYEEELFSILP